MPTADGLTAARRSCAATSVTFIASDGIGPEVIEAAPRVLDAGGAWPVWEEFAAGTAVFRAGIQSELPDNTIDSISQTRVVVKGPLETSGDYGEESARRRPRRAPRAYTLAQGED